MTILAIQSQVVYGHVGNSAAAFALQRLGFEVWPAPTAVLSNHPGHGAMAGRITPAAELAQLIDGIDRLGVLSRCRAVLSGYLGEPANGPVVGDAVGRVRAANRDALWLCDPVIGDAHTGIYVADGLPEFFRDHAAPAADVLTPNQFELAWLTGREIDDVATALAAADALRERGTGAVFCTSLTASLAADRIGTLATGAAGAWLATTPRLKKVPHGAGDLFAALVLVNLLEDRALPTVLEAAIASVYEMLLKSVAGQSDELLLVAAQDSLVGPTAAVEISRLR